MGYFLEYKKFGCCTRKVLFEKKYSREQNLHWVMERTIKAIKRGDLESVKNWESIQIEYRNPERFDKFVYKTRNEVELK